MSDTGPQDPQAAPQPAPSAKAERDAQLIVSLAIIAALAVIGIALMVTAYCLSSWGVASVGVGSVIGALATALNAPSGISNALRAAKGP